MSENPYPAEELVGDIDDGTMPGNIETLAGHVVGRKIVSVEKDASVHIDLWGTGRGTLLTLDNGKQVILENTSDCCAFTEVENVILHLDKIDHVITGVGTTEEFERWHIYADLGDVVELEVGWSPGNPFYYGYGFDIQVRDIPEAQK
ncbi:DUF7448 domain-containing protein [Glutamicibacter sp.]|uniref:DUF7448 domain-containing protein n=1 Tax=Glutamicibacter sp. TaxID=1931995 RepID=UPI003D6BCB99